MSADPPRPPQLYLIASGEEIVRRRAKVPKGQVVEAWPDALGMGFWVGPTAKTLLDAADAEPLAAALTLPADCVPIYYGPHLGDLDSLPPEESVATRVLSVHAMAVAWITRDRFGERQTYEPQSPADPVFHLRRAGTGVGHLWRLFRTRAEAAVYLGEMYGKGSEAVAWAEALPVEDFDGLIRRAARPG